MNPIHKRMKICCSEQWLPGRFDGITAWGDGLRLDLENRTQGRYCLPAIDSGESGFHWSRVVLDAFLPEDTALKVFAYASDDRGWGDWTDLGQGLKNWQGDWDLLIPQLFGEPVGESPDFYVKKTGRYLWLLFELIATGAEAPEIHSLSVTMAGDHMIDYLPEIYQKEDFTHRFLSIFDSLLMDLEHKINLLPRLMDFENTTPEMLAYLASWVSVEGENGQQMKERVATALSDYETQYTPAGICRTIRRLTGKEARIIEHFNVSPNLPDCADPNLYRRLYGEDPYRFFVLMEEEAFADRRELEDFLRKMEDYIPAGIELELVRLRQGIQLGGHTYLGINSRVGGYVPATIDESMSIHYDTMIGGTTHES